MKRIKELLSEAHKYIDEEMNCETAEYRALDKLEQALRLLARKVEEMDRSFEGHHAEHNRKRYVSA